MKTMEESQNEVTNPVLKHAADRRMETTMRYFATRISDYERIVLDLLHF
jgi:hypothetical protein